MTHFRVSALCPDGKIRRVQVTRRLSLGHKAFTTIKGYSVTGVVIVFDGSLIFVPDIVGKNAHYVLERITL